EPNRAPTISYASVTDRFFETLRAPLLSGGGFAADLSDTAAAVAVVNERMARQLWRDTDPVGRQFGIESMPDLPPVTVVGVSANVANWNDSDQPLATAYVHFAALGTFPSRLLVRTDGAVPVSFEAISNAVGVVAPD